MEENILKRVGNNIKILRTRLNFTQEKFALKANLNKNYFSDVERGYRNASIKSLEKISKAFDVDLSILFVKDIQQIDF